MSRIHSFRNYTVIAGASGYLRKSVAPGSSSIEGTFIGVSGTFNGAAVTDLFIASITVNPTDVTVVFPTLPTTTVPYSESPAGTITFTVNTVVVTAVLNPINQFVASFTSTEGDAITVTFNRSGTQLGGGTNDIYPIPAGCNAATIRVVASADSEAGQPVLNYTLNGANPFTTARTMPLYNGDVLELYLSEVNNVRFTTADAETQTVCIEYATVI